MRAKVGRLLDIDGAARVGKSIGLCHKACQSNLADAKGNSSCEEATASNEAASGQGEAHVARAQAATVHDQLGPSKKVGTDGLASAIRLAWMQGNWLHLQEHSFAASFDLAKLC